MKRTLLLIVIVIFDMRINFAQNKSWRSDKKNEISLYFHSLWNNDAYSWGLGYERTIYQYKNNKNSFLSIHSSVFIRSDNFNENFSEFISSRNQAQVFIKYSVGYKKIFSMGLGTVIVGERFYPNPTALLAYKYDLPKAKATLGLQFQLSLNSRVPPAKLKSPPLPTSVAGYNKSPRDILRNWCGGISIGKYF
jgi:hypothetical protein